MPILPVTGPVLAADRPRAVTRGPIVWRGGCRWRPLLSVSLRGGADVAPPRASSLPRRVPRPCVGAPPPRAPLAMAGGVFARVAPRRASPPDCRNRFSRRLCIKAAALPSPSGAARALTRPWQRRWRRARARAPQFDSCFHCLRPAAAPPPALRTPAPDALRGTPERGAARPAGGQDRRRGTGHRRPQRPAASCLLARALVLALGNTPPSRTLPWFS